MSPDARRALDVLWADVAGDPAALESVRLTGADPILPGTFNVGAAALASGGAAALAAAELWRIRTGRRQSVSLDVRGAVTTFRSERYLRVDGQPSSELWAPLSGFYRAGDARWVQLHCNFAEHEAGVRRVLDCARDRTQVSAAIGRRDAADIEEALAAEGLPVALVRTPEEWRAHPQAAAIAALPLVEITRIGDAPAEPCGAGDRPLGGVRVLDLTRVIAGPVCGRTLAEHGADVLRVGAPHLSDMAPAVMDTGRGKLSTWLDLRRADDAARLRALVKDADVVCQAYRPQTLAARGFGPEALATLRPGLVYVTLSAYGRTGPWRARRGFDSIVQSASGIAHEGGAAAGADGPRHLPAQALDHGTGHLAAFGAMVALARRAREGGSYLVELSLARTGRWIEALGRSPATAGELTLADVGDLIEESNTPFGRMRAVAPTARLSETPGRWTRPAVPLGAHRPAWPAPPET